MADLKSLQPADNSPAAIAAALGRCAIAGRGALAEIERLKLERVALLRTGGADQLETNLAALSIAMADATRISELLDRLQEAVPTPSAEEEARAKAIQATVDLAAWWTTQCPALIKGLQTMATTMAAISEWQNVAARATPPDAARAGNVTQLQPRPPAA